jgi:hypothetical protein
VERENDLMFYENLREVAALRHSFHIDGRLRLEFLSTVSKLLREHEVPVSNRLLSSLVLAVSDELTNENGHDTYAHSASTVDTQKAPGKPKPPQTQPPGKPKPPQTQPPGKPKPPQTQPPGKPKPPHPAQPPGKPKPPGKPERRPAKKSA